MSMSFFKNAKTMEKDIEKLQQGLIVASTATPTRAAMDAEEFDRAPDSTIITISAQEEIS